MNRQGHQKSFGNVSAWGCVLVALAGIALLAPSARGQDYDWGPLGSGLSGTVAAVTVYNGELIAGGFFTGAGGGVCNRIARWNGGAWQPLELGMSAAVHALTVYNGELIAGGAFTTAGGVTCNYIARWDGSAWHPLGSGMGPFVYALAVYNGELIAGGRFTSAGGVPCNHIARWDGSAWHALGSGIGGGWNPCLLALTVYNGELIVGGYDFTIAGGVPCNYIARWNGSNWQALGSGMDTTVWALAVYPPAAGELIAGASS